MPGKPIQPMVEKLKTRTVEEGDCWVWQGPKNDTGHPSVMLPGSRRKAMARRVMYEAQKGSIPAGYVVVTTCDNRLCLNPKHLQAVTLNEARKRAAARGEYKNPLVVRKRVDTLRRKSRITEDIVQCIKDAPTAKAAHLEYGISLGYAYAIRTGAARVPLTSPFCGLGA